MPIRYVRDGGGAGGGVELFEYGRGERHHGEFNMGTLSNCDPFLKDPAYTEPIYDPYWFCVGPPEWENVACVMPETDVRAQVVRSVGMIIDVHGDHVSTCTVTLVDADKVITAGHCLADPGDDPAIAAVTASVTFDYQTDCLGNRPPGYDAKFHKVAEVLEWKYDADGDYCLLRLAEPVAGVPPLQMRHDLPALGEPVFGVHHPNGAVKKLSIKHPAFSTVIGSTDQDIEVPDGFHVSGGSSGSALFDTAGRVLGVLSMGNPCGQNDSTPYPLRYFPTATFFQQTVPAPPPPVTRDVMVVFDRSGSMSQDDGTGRKKIEVARDAVSLFVQLVAADAGNRVGLVSFSTAASDPVDHELDDLTGASRAVLIGPAPYSAGTVGGLAPGGNTSIGAGIEAARLQFPAPGANPRAILLMTDGMQNTPPLIGDVDDELGSIDLHAVGFGTEANLNGPLLSALAAAHDGLYVRAGNGLALEKYFSQAFGNIFQAGILMDPEHDLPAGASGERLPFHVCDEETVTVVAGWDRTDAQLLLQVRTPGGALVTAASPGVEAASGRS
ncbi:MAG TPA: trypsin-like peptidase domain-containing protein [Longimicrobium sp.]|nr:trypsin-like peptidase domain-containing protein [Longimicrobium sp.]